MNNVKKNRFCASERRLGQKHSACGSHYVAGFIVSIPQAACSELSSVFEPAYVSGSNFKLFYLTLWILLFNLILLYFCKINSTRLFFQLLSESFGLTTGLVPPIPSVFNDDAETPFLTR